MNNEISLMPIKNLVLFPGLVVTLSLSTQDLATQKLIKEKKLIGVVTQKEDGDFYQVGISANVFSVKKERKSGDLFITINVAGPRFKIASLSAHAHGYKVANIIFLEDEPLDDQEKIKVFALLHRIKELWKALLETYEPFSEKAQKLRKVYKSFVSQIDSFDFSKLDFHIYSLAWNLIGPVSQQQDILETTNIAERLKKIIKALTLTIEIEKKIREVREEYLGKQEELKNKDFLSFVQKKIQEELGEGHQGAETDQLIARYQEIKDKIPKSAQGVIEDELRQLENRDLHSSDAGNLRSHLEYCVNKLPWGKETIECRDLGAVKLTLDEDHYGLDTVKERILEHLAVRKLNPQGKAPIICFVGPPGVGKTSLGKSIARSLGRNFIRISLGGVDDEVQIRGHRRTFVAAFPGRIIEGIVRANSINPVFMIDEIDKMTKTHGDPAAALLEVFDPEQNHSFQDNYVNFGFDLRKVFFIATANIIDRNIPPALKDRLEIIHLPGYSELEKINIAKKFLISKKIQETGIKGNGNGITFTLPAIEEIIRGYTDEAGVRNLERCIESICRSIALKITLEKDYPRRIEPQIVREFLGPPRFIAERAHETEAGEVIGLAWTETGGCILYIEAVITEGSGQISKTGLLGEEFQESIKVAATLIRQSHSDIDFEKKLIHVNAPADSSKDGPSAGLAIFLALESFQSNRPIRKVLAITGKINLKKRVLSVGGIREKLLAAQRAGIKEVILPKENEKSIEDLPQEIKEQLKFHFVETVDQAEKIAFSTNNNLP